MNTNLILTAIKSDLQAHKRFEQMIPFVLLLSFIVGTLGASLMGFRSAIVSQNLNYVYFSLIVLCYLISYASFLLSKRFSNVFGICIGACLGVSVLHAEHGTFVDSLSHPGCFVIGMCIGLGTGSLILLLQSRLRCIPQGWLKAMIVFAPAMSAVILLSLHCELLSVGHLLLMHFGQSLFVMSALLALEKKLEKNWLSHQKLRKRTR